MTNFKSGPWQKIEWKKSRRGVVRNLFVLNRADHNSLRATLNIYGSPHVPGATPLEEALVLLQAACEVEHALLVEYLYAAWSLGPNQIFQQILQIAVQEMCHFVTVQNLLLFLGSDPSLQRQDQDPAPALDPFPFTLRPFSMPVLEDFLLTEMPLIPNMFADQRAVMLPIIAKRSQQGPIVHPVGLIYAMLYWLFQENDSPTADWPDVASAGFDAGRHISSFPGQGTATTFQVDPVAEPKWHRGQDREGVFENIGSREKGLKTLFEIASQGEGLAAANDQQSHFATFINIYKTTDFGTLPLSKWPTDPFVSGQPASDAAREANRVTNPVAAALCGVFDARYRIALASIRAALSRDRTSAPDLVARGNYVGWAFEEMLESIKNLAMSISRLPCKAIEHGGPLVAAPTFNLENFSLPHDPAGLDAALLALHRQAATAITGALSQGVDAGTKFILLQMQKTDKKRFPNL